MSLIRISSRGYRPWASFPSKSPPVRVRIVGSPATGWRAISQSPPAAGTRGNDTAHAHPCPIARQPSGSSRPPNPRTSRSTAIDDPCRCPFLDAAPGSPGSAAASGGDWLRADRRHASGGRDRGAGTLHLEPMLSAGPREGVPAERISGPVMPSDRGTRLSPQEAVREVLDTRPGTGEAALTRDDLGCRPLPTRVQRPGLFLSAGTPSLSAAERIAGLGSVQIASDCEAGVVCRSPRSGV